MKNQPQFETLRDTLAEIPYFQPLLCARFAHDSDENGNIFVDRSGDLFAVILQYLRTFQRPPEPILARQASALLDECAFYGIDPLAQKIKGETCSMDLLPTDRRYAPNLHALFISISHKQNENTF